MEFLGRAAPGRFRQADKAKAVAVHHHGLIFWDLSHVTLAGFGLGRREEGRWRRCSEAMEVCSVPSLLVMTGEWHAWVTQ